MQPAHFKDAALLTQLPDLRSAGDFLLPNQAPKAPGLVWMQKSKSSADSVPSVSTLSRLQCPSSPIIGVPFECIGKDLVGLIPKSAQGHGYTLVILHYATRYPEAVPYGKPPPETL